MCNLLNNLRADVAEVDHLLQDYGVFDSALNKLRQDLDKPLSIDKLCECRMELNACIGRVIWSQGSSIDDCFKSYLNRVKYYVNITPTHHAFIYDSFGLECVRYDIGNYQKCLPDLYEKLAMIAVGKYVVIVPL
jgi:hypothetical protein